MSTGIIENIGPRGFGFIVDDSDGTRFFFNASDCRVGIFDTLRAGDHVTFRPNFEEGRGLRAATVRRRSEPALLRAERIALVQ